MLTPVPWWSETQRRRVTRLCARVTGDPSVAEDLAQETLLEAWRIRHRLVDPSGAGPWLDAIARNVCLRWRARRARVGGHEVSVGHADQHESPAHAPGDELADLLERDELTELLDRALRLLPAETRDALVARYVDELDLGEIGRRLALSTPAVSMRLSRGRARIRELLETDLADDPVAQVWVSRHGVAWRTVRVPCPTCTSATTSMRRDERAAFVETCCQRCDPVHPASRWSLRNPALRPHLTAVSRPTAVVGRMAAWSHRWWPAAIADGRAACTRCGRDVPIETYGRPGPADPRIGRGWLASCTSCHEVLSTSLLGLALCHPQFRALLGRRPRAHAVPTLEVTREGRPTLVVALRDPGSGDRVEMLFDDATARPLGAVASA